MGVLDWLAGISAHDAPIDEEYDRRAKREFAFEDAYNDIQDTLRREGIEQTYEPAVGVWKTKGGEPHPDVSNMDKWGHTPGGKRDLRALKLALEKYPDFDPVKLGAVREHWNSPMRAKTAWPAAPSDAPHAIKSTQSPVEMAIWWGPLAFNLARAGVSRAISTPSPKPGHGRLWRGEGTPGPPRRIAGHPLPRHLAGVQKPKPDWVSRNLKNARKKPAKFRSKQEKELINQADAAKRWDGGPGKKEVDFYLREYKNPLLRYIDVPKAVADKYHLPNMALKPGGKWTPHNPRAYSRNPTQEWYFPPRADAILQSSRVYRPPLPPFQPSSVAPPLALPFMEP